MAFNVTGNGIKYRAFPNVAAAEAEIGPFDAYDATVAQSHEANYGAVFVGEFNDVLDNQFELEEIAEHYKSLA